MKNPVVSTTTGFFLGAATQIRTGDLILTKRLVLAAMSIEISRETPFSRS